MKPNKNSFNEESNRENAFVVYEQFRRNVTFLNNTITQSTVHDFESLVANDNSANDNSPVAVVVSKPPKITRPKHKHKKQCKKIQKLPNEPISNIKKIDKIILYMLLLIGVG